MPNKINLITGETYTLSELFSGHRRIIIPDLQRDYCWGNDCNNLVGGFIDTLRTQFESNGQSYGKLSLGLLYGYEYPADFVQLCDGQQRITTLFLLLGMLNKWADGNPLRPLLMSDFEYSEDDHEPYLQYSIRESSLYFLSDLTYHFFAPTNDETEVLGAVNDIYNPTDRTSCSWFYGDYVNDPSVMSMLGALRTIEKHKDEFSELGLLDFAEFIANRLTFIYYDMGNRANGEETFVIINSTGEPLSATQNLKPLVLNAKINDGIDFQSLIVGSKTGLTLPQIWEEMENWFWLHRDKNRYDTADNGYNEFLRWVTLFHTLLSTKDNETKEEEQAKKELFREILKTDKPYIFPYESIRIDKIVSYYNAFITLYDKFHSYLYKVDETIPGQGDPLSAAQSFVVLPIIEYINRHPNANDISIKRLYEYLRNLIRINNVSKSVNTLVEEVVEIAAKCNNITDILSPSLKVSGTILTDEERLKLNLMLNPPTPASREEIDVLLWEAQNHTVDGGTNLFGGEIKPLLIWSSKSGTLDAVDFRLDLFKYYLKVIEKKLNDDISNNDKTRRAILASSRLNNYPRGSSYGWRGNWKAIINDNIEQFKAFLDDCVSQGRDNIITSNNSNSIVKYPQLLKYSDNKNIPDYHGAGKCICKRSWAQSIPIALATILLQENLNLDNTIQDYDGWHVKCTVSGNELRFTPFDDKSIPKEVIVWAINHGKSLKVLVDYGTETPCSYEIPVGSIKSFLIGITSTCPQQH